jgi:hypothetical protein
MQNTERITPRRQIRPLAIGVVFGVLGYFALAKVLSAVAVVATWSRLGDVGANVGLGAAFGALGAAAAAGALAAGFAAGGMGSVTGLVAENRQWQAEHGARAPKVGEYNLDADDEQTRTSDDASPGGSEAGWTRDMSPLDRWAGESGWNEPGDALPATKGQ